ncbi:MAG: N-acetylmuramoyl-L-alanine amidase, partial [Bacteroidales bacterium]|nr:N-acetylmuramoyl-L-alanine amidase [Bacteroidales bacterium]
MKRLTILFIALFVVNGAVFSQKIAVGQVKTVVIDPGHGGAKPGAIGKKSKEKDVTLSIALKLGKVITDNFEDVTVIYTRKTDVDISLAERARIANRAKADLFLSIHANSHPKTESKGVETFVMGLSNSKANLEVAKKENADILLEPDYKDNADYNGFDPNSPESYIMFALYQSAYMDKSLNFAKNIQDQYKSKIKTINRGVKQAELFVLYKTTSPSVLTEVGFISNPTEEEYINSDEGQADIVYCLFNAFAQYKAAEEGTKVITNPKFDIPGFNKDKKKQDAKNAKANTQTAKDTTKVQPKQD